MKTRPLIDALILFVFFLSLALMMDLSRQRALPWWTSGFPILLSWLLMVSAGRGAEGSGRTTQQHGASPRGRGASPRAIRRRRFKLTQRRRLSFVARLALWPRSTHGNSALCPTGQSISLNERGFPLASRAM